MKRRQAARRPSRCAECPGGAVRRVVVTGLQVSLGLTLLAGTALLLGVGCGDGRGQKEDPDRPGLVRPAGWGRTPVAVREFHTPIEVAESGGAFMGYTWRVARRNHVLYWEDRPYVPYGYWGGSIEEGIRYGLTEFTLGIPDSMDLLEQMRSGETDFEEAEREAARRIARITGHKGTYVIALCPEIADCRAGLSRAADVSDDDAFHYVNRGVFRIPASGRLRRSRTVRMVPFLPTEILAVDGVSAYLFDYGSGQVRDVSACVRHGGLASRGGGDEVVTELTAEIDGADFSGSGRLELTVLWHVRYARLDGAESTLCSGAGDYRPMWRPAVLARTRRVWEERSRTLRTPQLRGINLFGGEILLSRIFLFEPRLLPRRRSGTDRYGIVAESAYPDYNRDPHTLRAFRDWLRQRFARVEAFNEKAGTSYRSFEEADWVLPIRPNNHAEASENDRLFGIFRDRNAETFLSALQNEFHLDWFGQWYGHYAQMAKEIFGNVPTFTYAAQGVVIEDRWPSPASSVDVHIAALRHGVDGIGLSVYESAGQLTGREPNSFWNGDRLVEKLYQVETQSGKTKFLWLFEGSCVVLDPRARGGWLGPVRKRHLAAWLEALVGMGVRGFFAGAIFTNFGVEEPFEAVGRPGWFADLRDETVREAVATEGMRAFVATGPPAAPGEAGPPLEPEPDFGVEAFDADASSEDADPDAEWATGVALDNPDVIDLVRRHPDAQAHAEYRLDDRVWCVTVRARSRELAVVLVSEDGRVLNVREINP